MADRGEGRKLSPEELDDLLHGEPDHRCDTCKRAGFGHAHGSICNMTQPNGSRCDGVFARGVTREK